MASFQPELTVLQEADLTRSFLKALNFQNGPTKNEIDACNVLNFIRSHLDDTDPEISYLIESNLSYLHYYLGNFDMYYTNNGDNVRSSYNIDKRREIESSWISNGFELHKLLVTIIDKHKDNEWMHKNEGRHSICVYYALRIMAHLCMGQKQENIDAIIRETPIVNMCVDILNSNTEANITFIEHFATVRLLNFLIPHGTDILSIFSEIMHKCNLSIVKLLINQCCNSFHVILKSVRLTGHQKTILKQYGKLEQKPDIQQKNAGDSESQITYTRSPWADANDETRTLHLLAYRTRINSILSLKHLAKKIRNPKMMDLLCSATEVPSIYLKRLLQVSMLYMRAGKHSYPSQQNTIDIVSVLAQNKSIAERLVSDAEIIEMLIICIRSRAHMCEFQSRESIVILYCIVCEHGLLPKQYCNDLILALNDIKEMNWKNISFYSNIFPHYTLSIMVIKMLTTLFGVQNFEKINQEKYGCAICQNELQYPYTVKCGHSFCFGCLDLLLAANTSFYAYFIENKRNKANKCPLCRSAVIGQLNRVDSKSDFVLNQQLFNQMKSELVCITEERKSEFEGTEYEYWEYMKTNRRENVLNEEFIDFCEFMKKKSEIHEKGKIKEAISKANEIKMKGNEFFKHKNYENAIEKYREALDICPLNEYKLRSKYYSNIALCYVTMKDYLSAYKATQNGLSLIYSPIEDRTFVKLTNNMIISLNQLLKEQKIFNEYHNIINIGLKNLLCPNRRLYDILLFQCLWDFQFWHSQYRVRDSGIQTVENMMEIKKTDPHLLKMKEIEEDIERYLELNFDEHQLAHCFKLMQEKNEEEKNGNKIRLDSNIIELLLFAWEK